MKRKEIEFSSEELVGSVEAFAAHVGGARKLTLRTSTLKLPKPLAAIEPEAIGAIRRRLNVSELVRRCGSRSRHDVLPTAEIQIGLARPCLRPTRRVTPLR